MDTKQIIEEAVSRPVEERALIIDSLLRSINPSNPEIERKWLEVAKERLKAIKDDSVSLRSAEQVFSNIQTNTK